MGADLLFRHITKQDIQALSYIGGIKYKRILEYKPNFDECVPVRGIETKDGIQGKGYLLSSDTLVVFDYNQYKPCGVCNAIIVRKNVYRIDTVFSFICSVCRVFPELLENDKITVIMYKGVHTETVFLNFDLPKKLKLLVSKQNCLMRGI